MPVRGAPPSNLSMRQWMTKSMPKTARQSELSRPISAAESVLAEFGKTTLDRVSSVALAAERIIKSTASHHLPIIRRNYRTKVRSLLSSIGGSDGKSAASVAEQLEQALQNATLAYYLSLRLHNNNYHHLALLADYILLIEVCCHFPDGSQQQEDALVFLRRCESIVAPETFASHPDQPKACAAQPIVAALLEDWGHREDSQKLFAAHVSTASRIFGALHPATADAALQSAAFHCRHNEHGLCLRQCRVALSVVVLHCGLWNTTAGQLNFHIGTQLSSMGLQSQATFFFQRAVDIFEYVAVDAAGSTGSGSSGRQPTPSSEGNVDKSFLGSTILWHALSSFQLHCVQKEAGNSFVALRHLREAYFVLCTLEECASVDKKLRRGLSSWSKRNRQRLQLELHSILPIFTSERQEQLLRFAGATSLAVHSGKSRNRVVPAPTKPAIQQLAASCYESLSHLEKHLDVPMGKRTRQGASASTSGRLVVTSVDGSVSTASRDHTVAHLVDLGGVSGSRSTVGIVHCANRLLTICEDEDIVPAPTISHHVIAATISSLSTALSRYSDKEILAMGVPAFLENAFLSDSNSNTSKNALPAAQQPTSSESTIGELRRRFKQHSVMLQVILSTITTGVHANYAQSESKTSNWNQIEQKSEFVVPSSASMDKTGLINLFMQQLGSKETMHGAVSTAQGNLSSKLGAAGDSEIASAMILVDIYESNLARVYDSLAKTQGAVEGGDGVDGPTTSEPRSSAVGASSSQMMFSNRARFSGPQGAAAPTGQQRERSSMTNDPKSGVYVHATMSIDPSRRGSVSDWSMLHQQQQQSDGPIADTNIFGMNNIGGGWPGVNGGRLGFAPSISFQPQAGAYAAGSAIGPGGIATGGSVGPGGAGALGGPGGAGTAASFGANRSLLTKAHNELALDEQFSAMELQAAIERLNFQSRAASGEAIISNELRDRWMTFVRAAPNEERCAAELLTEFVENRVHVYAVLGDIGRHRAHQGVVDGGASGGVGGGTSRVMTDASGRRVHVTPFTAEELWAAAVKSILAVGIVRNIQRRVKGQRISAAVLATGMFTQLLRQRKTTQQRAKILVLGIMRGNALRRVARRARVAAKSLAVGIISRLGRLGDKAMEAPPIHNLPRPPGMMPGRGPPMMPGSGRKKKRGKKHKTRGVYLTESFGEADVKGSIWENDDVGLDIDGILGGDEALLANFSTKRKKKEKHKRQNKKGPAELGPDGQPVPEKSKPPRFGPDGNDRQKLSLGLYKFQGVELELAQALAVFDLETVSADMVQKMFTATEPGRNSTYTVLESIKAAGDWLQKKDPVTKKTWQPEQWVGVKGLEIEAFCVTMHAVLGSANGFLTRVKIIQFMHSFEDTRSNLLSSMALLNTALHELVECKRLHQFLKLMLRLTNKLNEGGKFAGAKAISVRDLDKLSACQTNDRKSAVFYLIEHLEDSNNEDAQKILTFPEELVSLERASKIPQRNFQNSCAALRNKMEFMRSMIEKKPPEWKAILGDWVDEKTPRLEAILELKDSVLQKYAQTAKLIPMEKPNKAPVLVEDYLTAILNFVSTFSSEVIKMRKKKAAAQRRAEKAAAKKRKAEAQAAKEAAREMDDLLAMDDIDDPDSPMRRRPKASLSKSISREYGDAEERAARLIQKNQRRRARRGRHSRRRAQSPRSAHVVKSGWLMKAPKQRGELKADALDTFQLQLKRRWFRLQDTGSLDYFVDDQMHEHKGLLSLLKDSTVHRMDSSGGHFGFVVEASSAALLMQAKSDKEAAEWVDALQQVLAKQQ